MHVRPYHFAIPVGFEDSTALVSLRVALRKPDAAIYAIRLWHHRHRCGEVVSDLNPAAVLEDIAGWRGKRGALVDAMLSAGLLARGEDESEIEIVDPHDVARVEWMGGRAEKAGESQATETPAERRKRLDRERKRAEYRKRKAAEKSGESAENPKSLRIESGESPQVSKSLHGNSPQVSTEKTGESAENSTSNARARTKTKTKTLKNSPISPHRGQLAPTEDPTKPNTEKPASPKPKPKALDDPRITEVLQHWQTAVGCEQRSIEDLKRRRRIRARLDEGFSVEQLKACADGAARDDWLMGRDPRSNGRDYRDVQTVYRDRPQVERLIELAEKPIESIRTDSNGKPIPLGINEGHKIYEANNPMVLEGPDPWDVEEELVEAAQ